MENDACPRLKSRCLYLAVLSSLCFGCVSEREDVAPVIESITLRYDGSTLRGTVEASYTNLSQVRLSFSRPELRLVNMDNVVKDIALPIPAGFDLTFGPGERRSVTYTIDDSTSWAAYCGGDLEAKLVHRSDTVEGRPLTSIGPGMTLRIDCF